MTKITTKFLKEKITQDWLKNPIFQYIVKDCHNSPSLFLEKNWKRLGKRKTKFEKITDECSLTTYWTIEEATDNCEFSQEELDNQVVKFGEILFLNLTKETIKNEVVFREFVCDEFCVTFSIITNEEDTEILAVFSHMG